MTEEKKAETKTEQELELKPTAEKELEEKSADKKEIEVEEEERAKMMVREEVSRSEVEKKKKVLEEAVEGAAKRRAPIGGIRVPGFLRVSRSRGDKTKDGEGEGEEGADLLGTPGTEGEKSLEGGAGAGGQHAGASNTAAGGGGGSPATAGAGGGIVPQILSKINFKAVPFLKRKKQPSAAGDDGVQQQQPSAATDVEKQQPEDEAAQQQPPPRKPRLINAIKLPLASLIPNKLKSKEEEAGGGPPAGLASVETLDDSNGGSKQQQEESKMEVVKLDTSDADPEKAVLGEEADSTWAKRNWSQYLNIVKEYRIAFGGVAIFLVLLLVLILYMAVSPKASPHAPIENGRYIKAVTSCGHVEGLLEEGIFTFRGIPYAKPPLGPLRFAPPQAFTLADCWNDTLKAHNASLPCWTMFPNGTIDGTEDCLYLDVYTPQVRYDSPLPVVVAVGVSELGLLPALAKSKEMVVVIPRLRWGPLGFTATHHLSLASYPRTSGNYGLADLIAALRWVSLNVENFGGDRSQVTVLGYRQGATLATLLTVIQRPEKLIKRLWLSSGSAVFPNASLAESEQEAEDYMGALRCSTPSEMSSPMSAACLRRLDVEELLDSVPDHWRPVPRGGLPMSEERRLHSWLVQDGVYVRESPYQLWERTQTLPLQVVIGTTAHSETSRDWEAERSHYTGESVRRTLETSLVGKRNLTGRVLELYNASLIGLAEIVSDIATVCPLYFLAEKIPGAKFYIMTQNRADTLVYGGTDVEAILGWASSPRAEARRAGTALLGLFSRFAGGLEAEAGGGGGWGSGGSGRAALRIGQDVFPLLQTTDGGLSSRCLFWREAGFVPQYSWVD